jgi:general nucleoside transport system permease protein
MSTELIIAMIATIVTAATPLLFAALGELVTEKSGVLNLGVEGMMLIGAVTAFGVTMGTGSWTLGILAGALAGMALALVFGFLTLTLMSNQVATGLALTIFSIGLSALIGADLVGKPVPKLPPVWIPMLSDLPVIGKLLFGYDILVYLSIAAVAGISWFLKKTRGGMILRAIGESDTSAHSIGYNVIWIRYLAVAFGGLMSGIGGAYLSVAYTPLWVEEMTAGRGWIALALVVFAAWRPWRALAGAYLFGGITILQLSMQGLGTIQIPAQVMAMLPYIVTIVVLTMMSMKSRRGGLGAPACLGKPFRPAT